MVKRSEKRVLDGRFFPKNNLHATNTCSTFGCYQDQILFITKRKIIKTKNRKKSNKSLRIVPLHCLDYRLKYSYLPIYHLVYMSCRGFQGE